MKEFGYKDKHYPVEYLMFHCRNEDEALLYIQKNQIWTDFLSSKKGFVSTTSYINKGNPGEVRIVIIWETLEDWLSIPEEELIKTAMKFDEEYNLPYESGRRIHNENNFGFHQVAYYEVGRKK